MSKIIKKIMNANQEYTVLGAGGSDQTTTMPTPSAENLGTIVQYVGDTNQYYTNGYFYKVVSNGEVPPTYSREQVDTQPASSGEEHEFITQAAYDALTPAQKAEKVYMIKESGTPGTVLTAGAGIDISNNEISVDTSTAPYDNTTSGATATNVQDAIDEVFQSVSNGKELIADAITDKGVSTSATDSFQTMANNIGSLEIATEGQIAAYGLAHGKDVLLFSIPLYTDHSSDGENLLLYNGIGFEDKEYYIIGKKTSYSSSEEYNFDIYEFYKNGTYNKTDINFDISKSDGNPPYIQWENRYKISGDEQYRYFVYAKGYSYDHPPYGTYLRFDTQTGVLEKYTTEIPYNDAIIANERITLPYTIAYTTINASSGKVANIVARI